MHAASNTFTSAIAGDPFSARFGMPLPLGMREAAAGMSWQTFTSTYAPSNGPIRLGRSSVTPLGAGRCEYAATLAVGDTITQAGATACGPVSALTTMLYDAGFQLEILSFHQARTDSGFATFLLCEHDGRRHWAMGLDADAATSAFGAMIAGANLLHG